MPSKRTRHWLRRLALLALVLATYPTFVLTYTWSHVLQSPLPGGRHGPLDAYRHTLASAVVAYTFDARAIDLVNGVMERRIFAHRAWRSSVRDSDAVALWFSMGSRQISTP